MSPSIQVGLLSIATANLDQLQAFYQNLLGMPPTVTLPRVYVEFRLTGLRLGLYTSHHPDFKACRGASSLCLQVNSLDPMLANWADHLVSPVREDFHGREVDLWDPDGNRVVIHEPSKEFWDLMNLEIQVGSQQLKY